MGSKGNQRELYWAHRTRLQGTFVHLNIHKRPEKKFVSKKIDDNFLQKERIIADIPGVVWKSLLFWNGWCVHASVVSNIEPLDVRSFPLGKVCVRARSKFEIVIFCALGLARGSNQCQILGNTRKYSPNIYV